MGKYLKQFNSESDYQSYVDGGNFVKPNVSVIGAFVESGDGLTIDNVHYTADYGSGYGK